MNNDSKMDRRYNMKGSIYSIYCDHFYMPSIPFMSKQDASQILKECSNIISKYRSEILTILSKYRTQ